MLSSPCLSIQNGHLHIDEVDTTTLAADFGTPLFVISERQLRNNFRTWQSALASAWPEGPVHILPSFKANPSLALRHILSEEGAGCDTFGPHELEAVLQCGVAPELISVNGGAKDRHLLRRAIEVGARITLDHPNELPIIQDEAQTLGTVATIRFRLRLRRPNLDQPSDLMPDMPIDELLRLYKPGIPFATALALGKTAISMPNVDLAGLHVHIARNASDLGYWQTSITNLAQMIAEFHQAWDGWRPRELDLGGGFSYPHDPAGRGDPRVAEKVDATDLPTPELYASTLTDTIREQFSRHQIPIEGMALEIEPGRALYGNCGIHLARVCDIKKEESPTPWQWVETDSSEIFLSGIALEHADFPVMVANKADAQATETADIVGISCNFELLISQAPLPKPTPGDIIAFLNTGAYEEANGSNFNLLSRPATVLVSGGSAELIRRRETLSDILARDLVPGRFSSEKTRKT